LIFFRLYPRKKTTYYIIMILIRYSYFRDLSLVMLSVESRTWNLMQNLSGRLHKNDNKSTKFIHIIITPSIIDRALYSPNWTCMCISHVYLIYRHHYQWGIFPVWEIRGFPILLSRSGKKCQNLSRSGNKMINFYMPQHIARRIKTNQRIA